MLKVMLVVSQFLVALHHCTSPQRVLLLIPLQIQAALGLLLLHYITMGVLDYYRECVCLCVDVTCVQL